MMQPSTGGAGGPSRAAPCGVPSLHQIAGHLRVSSSGPGPLIERPPPRRQRSSGDDSEPTGWSARTGPARRVEASIVGCVRPSVGCAWRSQTVRTSLRCGGAKFAGHCVLSTCFHLRLAWSRRRVQGGESTMVASVDRSALLLIAPDGETSDPEPRDGRWRLLA